MRLEKGQSTDGKKVVISKGESQRGKRMIAYCVPVKGTHKFAPTTLNTFKQIFFTNHLGSLYH